MNHKQKLGYMVLGAWIMAVGIIIGQFITPNIEAQSNGVFDEIQCSKLTMVDRNGKKAIVLESDKYDNNHLIIYHPQGDKAIRLWSNEAGTCMIEGFNHIRDGGVAFQLGHYAAGNNKFRLWNKVLGGTDNYPGIELECNEKENRVFVMDRRFEWEKSFKTRKNTGAGVAIGLHCHYFGNEIFVVNPQTGTMRTLEDR